MCETKSKLNAKNLALVVAAAVVVMSAVLLINANPVFAAAGIDSLFNTANSIAAAIQAGFQGLVLTVAVASGVYTAIRWLIASDPKEGQMYKKRLIVIVAVAFVAFFLPEIINWTKTLADQIKL